MASLEHYEKVAIRNGGSGFATLLSKGGIFGEYEILEICKLVPKDDAEKALCGKYQIKLEAKDGRVLIIDNGPGSVAWCVDEDTQMPTPTPPGLYALACMHNTAEFHCAITVH